MIHVNLLTFRRNGHELYIGLLDFRINERQPRALFALHKVNRVRFVSYNIDFFYNNFEFNIFKKLR